MPITGRLKNIVGFFVCTGFVIEIDILFIPGIPGESSCIKNKIFIPTNISLHPGKNRGNTNQWGEIPRYSFNIFKVPGKFLKFKPRGTTHITPYFFQTIFFEKNGGLATYFLLTISQFWRRIAQ